MFGRGRFLDGDVEDWHIECWAWLLRNSGGLEAIQKRPLILPNADFFTPTNLEGEAKAQHIFAEVQSRTPLAGKPVQLEAQQTLAGRVSTFGIVQNPGAVSGTFRMEKEAVIISYDPDMLQHPVNLIATFAHELSHFLNLYSEEAPPGGWDLEEPATDVCVACLGFGIFGANSAFDYTQTQDFEGQGWAFSKRGYITEAEWVFGIAMFAALSGADLGTAKPYLKSHLWSQLKKAEKYMQKKNIVSAVLSYT